MFKLVYNLCLISYLGTNWGQASLIFWNWLRIGTKSKTLKFFLSPLETSYHFTKEVPASAYGPETVNGATTKTEKSWDRRNQSQTEMSNHSEIQKAFKKFAEQHETRSQKQVSSANSQTVPLWLVVPCTKAQQQLTVSLEKFSPDTICILVLLLLLQRSDFQSGCSNLHIDTRSAALNVLLLPTASKRENPSQKH